MKQLTAVVLGAGGQLGKTISHDWSLDEAGSGITLHGFDHRELDISEPGQLAKLNGLEADVIINTAAYTAVDKAEQEQQRAFRINRDGAGAVASWAKAANCRLIHISTDFVFDGKSTKAYKPDDATNPVSVYGQSKLAGEQAVQQAHPLGSVIIRTGWLYSRYNANFVKTMLKLMVEKDQLNVVADQLGTPTSTHSLAQLIAKVVTSDVEHGIFHWSDAGTASWYDFAVAIQQQALAAGLLDKAIPVHPITTQQYPTPAARPPFSVLDKSSTLETFSLTASPWREQLKLVINELAEQRTW